MARGAYKPDLERMMREVARLDVVNPLAWARTFEASGITPEMVIAAVKAEKLRRDQIEADIAEQAVIRHHREESVDE